MPLFEYRCGACGHDFEHLVLRSAEPPHCPACQSGHVTKLLSLPTVSSEQTRDRASRAVRTRNRATRRDQGDAEVKRIQAHNDDHGE